MVVSERRNGGVPLQTSQDSLIGGIYKQIKKKARSPSRTTRYLSFVYFFVSLPDDNNNNITPVGSKSAQDFFHGTEGLIATYEFNYQKIIEFKTKVAENEVLSLVPFSCIVPGPRARAAVWSTVF